MEIFLAMLIGFIAGVLAMSCILCCSIPPAADDENNDNNNENEEQTDPPNVARITIVRPMPLGAAVQVKVEKITYDECIDESSKDGGCAICQDEYRRGERRATIDSCSHRFHAGCIESWLQTNDNCPLCRHHLV